MTPPECLRFQQAMFEADDGAAVLDRRPDLAAHQLSCAGCRAWLDAFVTGVEAAAGASEFAAGVIVRTAGGACTRARELTAATHDEPLAATEQALVAVHLETCSVCRAVAEEMTASVAALPELAEIDPGPAFTARVLAATSRQPAPARAVAWWRRRWDALVSRPLFAVEAAYALTLVLVLVAGNPLSAFDRTAARVEPLVMKVGAPVRVLDASIRALRDRVAGSTERAGGIGAGGRTWADWTGRMGHGLVATISAALTRAAEVLESAASWVREWALSLLGRARPDTEPGKGGVR